MRDQTFDVEVTADRLDAALPIFAEATKRQGEAALRNRWFTWPPALTASAIVWSIIMPRIAPEVRPRDLFVLIAVLTVIQSFLFVFLTPLIPSTILSRWSARLVIRRTKKHAPFSVRYRVSDHEYHSANNKLGIDRHIRCNDVAVAYRTRDLIILYRWRFFNRPLSFVYLADDAHRRAMDRFLDAGRIQVHDLPSGGGSVQPPPAPDGIPTPDAIHPPQAFGAQAPERVGGSGCGKFALGCGLVTATVLVLFSVGIYLVWPGFVGYMIHDELTEFRVAVENAGLDPQDRDEFVKDLEAVRVSLDDRQNFGIFQWTTISGEFRKVFEDGRLDPGDPAILRTEIGRMKRIQGIEAD